LVNTVFGLAQHTLDDMDGGTETRGKIHGMGYLDGLVLSFFLESSIFFYISKGEIILL
jgi:hypothetical protein